MAGTFAGKVPATFYGKRPNRVMDRGVVIVFENTICPYKERNDRVWNFLRRTTVISHMGRRVRHRRISGGLRLSTFDFAEPSRVLQGTLHLTHSSGQQRAKKRP